MLKTARGEICCPVIVLTSDSTLPPHSHGRMCSGVGVRAKGDRRGLDSHIEMIDIYRDCLLPFFQLKTPHIIKTHTDKEIPFFSCRQC